MAGRVAAGSRRCGWGASDGDDTALQLTAGCSACDRQVAVLPEGQDDLEPDEVVALGGEALAMLRSRRVRR